MISWLMNAMVSVKVKTGLMLTLVDVITRAELKRCGDVHDTRATGKVACHGVAFVAVAPTIDCVQPLVKAHMSFEKPSVVDILKRHRGEHTWRRE